MKKLIAVIGTRPEAIKMAPLILALRRESWVDLRVLATAQHRQLLDQVLGFFGIAPDIDLDLMQPDQSLSGLTARLLLETDRVLRAEQPDAVLVQGDTTTVMAVTLACYYQGVPVGHVEAGLRTGNLQNPFPEEANRVITGKLARWHFAPTESARENLRRDGVAAEQIAVTGNTVIDALLLARDRPGDIGVPLDANKRLILVTAHRRENFGAPLREICAAIADLAAANADVQFLFPLHPNPNIGPVVRPLLEGLPNVILCPPLDYPPFVAALQRAYLVLTDSGGVQEEAPALGKPVLVLREETERPEAIAAGVVKRVGPHREAIVRETQRLLDEPGAYAAMALGASPYGDGRATPRIVEFLRSALG